MRPDQTLALSADARKELALKTPLPQPRRPLPFCFELHKDPIWDHPLWIHRPETVPGLRVDCRMRGKGDGTQVPVPAAGPADTVYAFVTGLVRYLERFGRYMGPRGRTFNWCAIPSMFGVVLTETKYPNVQPLLRHPADNLASGRWGIFSRRGIEWNRAWSTEMLEHLADELKRQRLPDPAAWVLVSENGPVDDYEGHLGNPDVGWYPKALADARAGDAREVIDGRRTLRQYDADARAIDGKPVPAFYHQANAPRSAVLPRNADNTDVYLGAVRLIWDWAREAAFNEPARRAFARDPADPSKTPKTAEYLAACDSKWAPLRRLPLAFTHQMDGIFHTDLQCPGYYRDKVYMIDDATFTPQGPGFATRTNWRKIYAVEGKTSEEVEIRLGMEYAKEMARNHARSAPTRPLAPWVGERNGLTTAEAVEYIEHCRDLGAWCVFVFSPLPDKAHHDYWLRVIEAVNGR